jgi:hypothetical protein
MRDESPAAAAVAAAAAEPGSLEKEREGRIEECRLSSPGRT